jgi:hypothetical protein
MTSSKFDKTVYSIQSFLQVEVELWGNQLKAHINECMNEEAGYSQRKAWFDCFNILKREFTLLNLSALLTENIFIVFEYELPRERGRRPDVLILSGNNVIVLEFKGFSHENIAQIDQAKHYARDLKNYHEQSHNLNVVPMLILASGKEIIHEANGVQIISGDKIHLILKPLLEMEIPFKQTPLLRVK